MSAEIDEYYDSQWYRPYLLNDEYVLWHGAPVRTPLFTGADLLIIPFMMFWLGGVGYWEYVALTSDAPKIMALFGLPFVAVGLYMLIGRPLMQRLTLKRSYYAITNRRVIKSVRGRIDARALDNLPALRIRYEKNGEGSILFDDIPQYTGRGGRLYVGTVTGFAFVHIADAQRVYSILVKAVDDLKKI